MFFKIHFNIILTTPSSSECVCLKLCHQNSYLLCLSCVPWHDNMNIWWKVQIMKLLIMKFSPVSLFGPNIILSTLFSNTPSPCSSLKVSRPHQTAGKIIVLCMSICMVLCSWAIMMGNLPERQAALYWTTQLTFLICLFPCRTLTQKPPPIYGPYGQHISLGKVKWL